MNYQNFFKQYVANVYDFPIKGIIFRDITPTLENPKAFKECIDALEAEVSKYEFDKIVCAEARGFLFGAALAYKMGKGIVVARKPNKLPRPGLSYSYTLEYGQNKLVISDDAIKEGEKCLILDDLLATGGSSLAMINLVKMAKGNPVCAAFYIELPDLKGRQLIEEQAKIPVISLVKFEGE